MAELRRILFYAATSYVGFNVLTYLAVDKAIPYFERLLGEEKTHEKAKTGVKIIEKYPILELLMPGSKWALLNYIKEN